MSSASPTDPVLPFARHSDLPALRSPALLLVDFQRAFVEPGHRASVPDAAGAWENAAALLTAFRSRFLPVIATRHAHRTVPKCDSMARWWSSFLLEGQDESELCDAVLRRADLVLTKDSYSAFHGTKLEWWLRARRVETLVIAGVMTHICVDSTARDAFHRGFDVVIAEDACASKARPLHDASLLTLSHALARVTSSARLVEAVLRRGER